MYHTIALDIRACDAGLPTLMVEVDVRGSDAATSMDKTFSFEGSTLPSWALFLLMFCRNHANNRISAYVGARHGKAYRGKVYSAALLFSHSSYWLRMILSQPKTFALKVCVLVGAAPAEAVEANKELYLFMLLHYRLRTMHLPLPTNLGQFPSCGSRARSCND